MTSNDGQNTAPTRKTAPEGGSGDGVQVHDKGTTAVPASKVANAAAETLHGTGAVEEKYAQPDAKALVGGATLVSDPKGANPAAGERA
jgi:hypothetical protein